MHIYSRKEIFHFIMEILPPRISLSLQHFRRSKRWPNINRPTLFSDKILHRKAYENNDIFSTLSDKVEVKNFVSHLVGEEYVIPTLWSGKELPDNISEWDRPFVIKSNHSSGWNIFIKNNCDYDWDDIRNMAHSWLTKPWLPSLHERWYNRIERKILIEPFIGPNEEFLSDYKLFCFQGKVKTIQIDTQRFLDHKRNYYSPEWISLSIKYGYPPSQETIEKPRHLEKMIELAEIIGKDLPFARIDFYDLEDGPKFGEITFAPDAGVFTFDPIEYDIELGKEWTGQII